MRKGAAAKFELRPATARIKVCKMGSTIPGAKKTEGDHMDKLTHLLLALAAAAALAVSVPTFAQQAQGDSAEAQVQRQQTQPLNNAPVWREVRSGAAGSVSPPMRFRRGSIAGRRQREAVRR